MADKNATSVTFRRALPELNLEIIKRYTLEPVPAATSATTSIIPAITCSSTSSCATRPKRRNRSPISSTARPACRSKAGGIAHKISRHRWFGGAGLRDVVVRFDGNPVWQIDCPQIAEGDVEPMGDGAGAGVRRRRRPILRGRDDSDAQGAQRRVVRHDRSDRGRNAARCAHAVTFTNVTCRMTRQPLRAGRRCHSPRLVPGFHWSQAARLAGQYQAAGDPNHSLKDIVYYGLALFGAVARAMLGILHFFYSIVGNYGIAIVMLTVLVRGAMFPISFKQTQNMARMQALKPEMDRITEKYKTDMQKRSQAIQELYRKHNINPLGGCLPVFLQLPIFIGLYRALMVDVELRMSPLFGESIRWCSNLAAPDMFLNWSSVMPEFHQQRHGHLRPRSVSECLAAGHGGPVPGHAKNGDAARRRTSRPSCSRR